MLQSISTLYIPFPNSGKFFSRRNLPTPQDSVFYLDSKRLYGEYTTRESRFTLFPPFLFIDSFSSSVFKEKFNDKNLNFKTYLEHQDPNYKLITQRFERKANGRRNSLKQSVFESIGGHGDKYQA